MALFNFGKKNKEKKAPACACSCQSSTAEEIPNNCCCETISGICSIKVLGAGCASCHQQYENAKSAVQNIGLDIEVEYITDMAKIMEYGVMSMPALVVNEKVVSTGKVIKAIEVEKILLNLHF